MVTTEKKENEKMKNIVISLGGHAIYFGACIGGTQYLFGNSLKDIREYAKDVKNFGGGVKDFTRKGRVEDAVKYINSYSEQLNGASEALDNYNDVSEGLVKKIELVTNNYENSINELNALSHQYVRVNAKVSEGIIKKMPENVENKFNKVAAWIGKNLYRHEAYQGNTDEENLQIVKEFKEGKDELHKIQSNFYKYTNETNDAIIGLEEYIKEHKVSKDRLDEVITWINQTRETGYKVKQGIFDQTNSKDIPSKEELKDLKDLNDYHKYNAKTLIGEVNHETGIDNFTLADPGLYINPVFIGFLVGCAGLYVLGGVKQKAGYLAKPFKIYKEITTKKNQ